VHEGNTIYFKTPNKKLKKVFGGQTNCLLRCDIERPGSLVSIFLKKLLPSSSLGRQLALLNRQYSSTKLRIQADTCVSEYSVTNVETSDVTHRIILYNDKDNNHASFLGSGRTFVMLSRNYFEQKIIYTICNDHERMIREKY
jgi:hypothetical protein